MSEAEKGQYLVPLVGAVVNLDVPAECLQAYDDVEAALRVLAEAKRNLAYRLAEYGATTGRRTVTVEGGARYEYSGGPESKVSYRDPAGLKRKLLAAGMPPARVDEIVVETIDRKVNGTQANTAARANPEYARIIEEHRVKSDAPYSITLKS